MSDIQVILNENEAWNYDYDRFLQYKKSKIVIFTMFNSMPFPKGKILHLKNLILIIFALSKGQIL